jgi:undecaprenyl-diphosphatase
MDGNTQLFLWLNATTPAAGSPAAQALVLALALFCAKYLIAVLPVVLVGLYGFGGRQQRRAVLGAVLSLAVAWGMALLINWGYPHPRPFVLGLGQLRMAHAPTPSFPSHHLTAWWAAAFALCWHRSTRYWGLVLAILGLSMAWARMYMGVHFPLDMVGAAGVGLVCAWVCAVLLAKCSPRLVHAS